MITGGVRVKSNKINIQIKIKIIQKITKKKKVLNLKKKKYSDFIIIII
jgi:hypothetical protein